MGIMENITQIGQLIKDGISASIIRERMELLKEQVMALENKVKQLEQEKSELVKENSYLKNKIASYSITEEFVEYCGALFKRKSGAGYHKAVFCPNCKKSVGALEDFMPFDCTCGWISNFHKQDLEKVIANMEKENL